MSVKGSYPIQQMPLLPIRGNPTQTQVSGVAGVANRTITTPQDNLSLTCNGISVVINPSMQTAGNMVMEMVNAGIAASLSRNGYLTLPATPTGNETLRAALGF